MNLKDLNIDRHFLEELKDIRQSLGAKYYEFKSNVEVLPVEVVSLGQHIDGTYEDIKDKLILIEGEPILDIHGDCRFLYIPDNDNRYYKNLEPRNLRKVHITYCSTLSTMKDSGRFERYRATIDTHGSFEVIIPINKKISTPLHVCKNCIKAMLDSNIKKYDTTPFNFKQFALDFRKLTPHEFKKSSLELKEQSYTNDWAKISREYRIQKNWICEECEKNMKNNPAGLETHHINGVKSDNRQENLKALCRACHQKQPFHG